MLVRIRELCFLSIDPFIVIWLGSHVSRAMLVILRLCADLCLLFRALYIIPESFFLLFVFTPFLLRNARLRMEAHILLQYVWYSVCVGNMRKSAAYISGLAVLNKMFTLSCDQSSNLGALRKWITTIGEGGGGGSCSAVCLCSFDQNNNKA